jgi:hypothetical protein
LECGDLSPLSIFSCARPVFELEGTGNAATKSGSKLPHSKGGWRKDEIAAAGYFR